MKNVAVLGVGMHPFGIWPDISNADMSLAAGMEALNDAGLTFRDIQAAYEEAGIGPKDIDLAQVHDAFAIEELLYYELLGFCREGEAEAAIERGDFELGGPIPVSTDGGLIARGHPGGPMGLAQIWETVSQLRGEAGARQVDNARIGLCHMMGGGSVCVIHILKRD